jgi:hypothetical protein
VAGGRAFLQQDALELGAVVFQQVGRPQVPGDQDRVLGQHPHRVDVARQVAQQPVVEVFQVVQALAQIGVAGLAQAGAVLGAHALDRRLGGQARAHGFLQRPVPAPVVGEHPVGLEHLVRGADQAVLAFQHLVDLGLQRLDRPFQPGLLGQGVVGQQLLGRHRLLVQHGHAVGQPLGEARPLQPLGLVGRDLDVLELGQAQQFAGADHLGQDHGDDLQVLDLFLVIDPLGAVLDDQDADGPAAAQQRHGQEGVVRVFAGFRAIRERRVAGGVGQVQRPAQAHGLADQAFAGLQRVTWTASRDRPSVANSSRSLEARRR